MDGVIGTNDDASACKRFAVERGYWEDPFITLLAPKGSSRRAPEINRGYYARVKAIEILVQSFIQKCDKECNIVSLGAGFDTLFWRLHAADLAPKSYVEIDFEQVTTRKAHFIKTKKPLLEALSDEDTDIMMSKSEIHSGCYHLVHSNLQKVAAVEEKLKACGLIGDNASGAQSTPTLFIAECVLVYMEAQSSATLLNWLAQNFNTAFFINYEQVNMIDSFGQVMVENLHQRGCHLAGVAACASLDTQRQRFLIQGWEGAEVIDMKTIYKCLPQADLQRMERLELLDEAELLQQLLAHYCLATAWCDKGKMGLKDIHL